MKLLTAALLSVFATAAISHGDHDHDHDAAPSTPPPKVGAPAADKKAEQAADPAAIKEEKAADPAKPADKKVK